MSGQAIKATLEDACDNLFNPDPYYQQGGDMLRVGGLQYHCNPYKSMGQRIDNMRLHDKPLEADKKYKVASWASVAEGAQTQDAVHMSDVVETWLKARGGRVAARQPNLPTIVGGLTNPGYGMETS
jgi:sulfur-oxidizing protein SoxB